MCSVCVETNDVFEELREDNNRLLNELIFAEKCLKKFNDFKVFIDSILDKISIDLNDKQKYEELKNNIDNSLSQRSVLSSLKSENETEINEEFSDNFDNNISETESNESEIKISDRRPLKSKRKTDISVNDNCNRKLNKTNKSMKTRTRKYVRCVQSNGLFVCPVDGCEYKTKRRDGITNHRQIHDKKIKCSHSGCDYRTYRMCALKLHMNRLHLNEESIPGLSSDLFRCDFDGCSFMTYRPLSLTVHKSKTHSEQKYYCPYSGCDYITTSKPQINVHLRRIHFSDEVKCPHSGCDYKSIRHNLKPHLRQIHNSVEEIPISEKFIEDFMLHSKKTRFTKHICHYEGCGKQFNKRHNLNLHVRYFHEQDSKELLKCEYQGCKYSNVNPNNLRRHIAIRHLEKTLKCDYPGCSYGTALRKILTQHKKIHAKDKPFACDWPGCQYKSRRKSTMDSHSVSHTNQYTVSCIWPNCDKKFKTKQHMRAHLLIHKGEKRHVCHWPGCQYRCITSGNLKIHMNNRHKNVS